jgi:CDP-diacylglycerol--glycerol-3-phosphate 3-phosphatidyltransferase
MNGTVWTFANGLSALRLLLAYPIALLLGRTDDAGRVWLFALIALAALTDFFDGLAARRSGTVTDVGKILDPLADKIVVGTMAMLLTLRGLIPAWFVAVVVGRDICILAGAWYLQGTRGVVTQSNILGKWTVTVTAAYLIAAVAGGTQHWTSALLLPASCALLALSCISYVRRFLAAAQNAGPAAHQK